MILLLRLKPSQFLINILYTSVDSTPNFLYQACDGRGAGSCCNACTLLCLATKEGSVRVQPRRLFTRVCVKGEAGVGDLSAEYQLNATTSLFFCFNKLV